MCIRDREKTGGGWRGTKGGASMKREPWDPDSFLNDADVQAKLRIMHAVDRSLDQITVTQICTRARCV